MGAKVRNYLFLGLLIGLFAEVLIIFPRRLGHQPEPEAPVESPKTMTGPANQLMKGVHLVESARGSRDWELFSEEAEGGQDQGHWNLKAARVLFYAKDKVEFTVTGDQGLIDTKTKDMRIRGHVVTTSANGYTFRTEEILYDAKARKITSPAHVQMVGPKDSDGDGMKVDGGKMVVDVELSQMTIAPDVRAEKALNGGRRMRVASQSAEFSGKNKEAKFTGAVVMDYDRVKLEGPEASFFQSSAGNFLSNIRFSGGVKVSDMDKFATSENLNLDLVANRFVFTGKPKVYQGNDELSGEEIIFLDGGKKVKVEKVRANLEKKEQ